MFHAKAPRRTQGAKRSAKWPQAIQGESSKLFPSQGETGSDFGRLSSDESVINCRQRIEVRGFLAELFGLVRVTFALISQAQAIKIVRVLLVGLLQLADRFVVVLLLESDHPN